MSNIKDSRSIKITFDGEKNIYTIKIDKETFEFTRAEAVALQNSLTKVLKSTPILNIG